MSRTNTHLKMTMRVHSSPRQRDCVDLQPVEGKEMGRSVGENTALMGLDATETRLSHAGDCLHAVSECGAKGGTEAFSEGSLGEASCQVSQSLRPLIYIKSKEHFQLCPFPGEEPCSHESFGIHRCSHNARGHCVFQLKFSIISVLNSLSGYCSRIFRPRVQQTTYVFRGWHSPQVAGPALLSRWHPLQRS
jgi:hypothetical protein